MQLTREELEAMGLSQEEIEAILGATKEDTGSGLPFKQIKVNYDTEVADKGVFGYNLIKDEDGFPVEFEETFGNLKFTPLKSYFQYTKWDAKQNKPTVKSFMFSSLREAKTVKDMLTGRLIEDIKRELPEDDKVIFTRVILVKLEDINKYAVWFVSKSYQYELGGILQKEKGEGNLTTTFTIKNKKARNGGVTYFLPELVDTEERDYKETLSEDAKAIKEFNKWVEGVNSFTTSTDKKETSTADIPEIDIEEDEIPFD